MYSYDGLNNLLKAKGMKKSDLASKLGISSRTIAKIGKGEKLADHVIVRLCVFFGCEKEDIFTKVCDNKTLQALREEKYAEIVAGQVLKKGNGYENTHYTARRAELRNRRSYEKGQARGGTSFGQALPRKHF